MADAFEILSGNSTAQVNSDAWNHLVNQNSGVGDVYVYGEIEVQLMADLEVNLENNEYEVELESDYEIELEDNEHYVEICV